MKWVVDTSVLIDHLRGNTLAKNLLLRGFRERHELWSVTVVRTEVLAGMRPKEEAATRALLAQIQWQDVNTDVADRAGRLAQRYLRSHRGVDTVDYLIASATELLGAELKTMNVKHFPMLPGLAPAY